MLFRNIPSELRDTEDIIMLLLLFFIGLCILLALIGGCYRCTIYIIEDTTTRYLKSHPCNKCTKNLLLSDDTIHSPN
jgi:uncharacterized protein YneF (UPF0154 family)